MDQERLLKRVWLINGLLLLVLLAALGVWIAVDLGSSWLRREPHVVAGADGAGGGTAPRAIRYGTPQAIWKSTTRIVLVRYGEAFERPSAEFGSASLYSERNYTPYVNVIFLERGSDAARLLLNRPALIRSVNFPSSESDSLQSWITYDIAFDDTDHDGGLDADDETSLYVSDLHGGGFRRVLPPGWTVFAHEPFGDGHRLVVLALQSPQPGDRRSPDEAPERAFLYDVQTGNTAPYTALDSLAARAARIVGR